MSAHDETLQLCEELRTTLAAAETHLRVLAALQLDFSSILKVYRDAMKRSHELLEEAGVPASTMLFSDLGTRDDTDELLNLAVLGELGLEDTDERAREALGTPIGQTATNVPAVPLDDGPEGTADEASPLATDETSGEASLVFDASDLEVPDEEDEGVQAAAVVTAPSDADDVMVMEEEEDASTEVMTAEEARARAIAMAAVEDSGEEPEPTEESEEHAAAVDPEITDPVLDEDEESTVVVEAADLELIDDITQPTALPPPEVNEDEEDQASVDEVILTKDQVKRQIAESKATPPPPDRAAGAKPTAKVKPKVKAKAEDKKDVSAKFYAASAAIPRIRDESTHKPRAAAVKLGGDGQSAQVLGGEDEHEPIAVGGVEDEDLLDMDGSGLTLEVEEAWEDWDEEEEVEEMLELSEDMLEELEPEEPLPSFSTEEVQDLLERARRAAKQGNIEAGVNFYSDVLDSDPDCIDAYIGRGRLYLDVGDYARAMSDFTVSEDLAPESPEPQVAVGDLYFARKDYRKAIEYFDAALQMAPDHAMAFCRRGISHYYRRNYKQALDDLNVAVKLDPEIPNIKTFVSMAKKKARTK